MHSRKIDIVVMYRHMKMTRRGERSPSMCDRAVEFEMEKKSIESLRGGLLLSRTR